MIRRPGVSANSVMLSVAIMLAIAVRLPSLAAPLFMDEVHILRAVSHYVTQRTVIPPWFEWPPLFSYLSVPVVGASALIGGSISNSTPTDWLLVQSAFAGREMVMGMRLLSLAFSVATIAIVWRMPPAKVGISGRFLCAMIYALSPIAIRYGAWGLADSGMTLCLAATTLLALRHSSAGDLRSLLLSGACVGIAAAFKYNGALGALSCAAAAICSVSVKSLPARLRDLTLAGLLAIAAFLALAPTWWLTPRHALDGFLWLSGNVRKQGFGQAVTPWIGVPAYLARHEPGFLLGAFLLPFGLLDPSNRRTLLIFAIVPLATYATVGGWARMDLNYWLPAFPGICAGCALGWQCLASRMPEKLSTALVSALTATMIATLLLTGIVSLRTDNWYAMRRWLSENLPTDATVIRTGAYTPKVWDETEKGRFLSERGNRLSPRGLRTFESELARQPRASRVLTTEETTLTVLSPLWSEPIPVGTWVLASELPMSRVLLSEVGPDSPFREAHSVQSRFYRSLLDGHGWVLMHEESQGSGQKQYAFRKETQR